MSVIQETLPHPPQVVFEALITPRTYPEWLVGCREIRTVDEGWPAVETRFHHRVGVVGPLTVEDSTKILAVDPPHELQLEVRFRPLGRGHVTFRLEPDGLQDTVVTIREEPLDHLAALKPVLDPLTDHRNRISLRRLAEHLDRVAAPA